MIDFLMTVQEYGGLCASNVALLAIANLTSLFHRILSLHVLDPNALDLSGAINFIFSWVVLMPIAVIVGGKLLSQLLRLKKQSRQVFKVPIPGILALQANDDEVILGFTGFILTLVLTAIAGGPDAYVLFKERFGIDPGQFNALCAFSSFINVIWAFLLYLMVSMIGKFQSRTEDVLTKERAKHVALMEKLSKRR